MTEHDLEAAHRLSHAVRWPHRLPDWQFAHSLGIGYVAETGKTVVGTVLCWHHGADYATLGMFIVHPEWRRKGVGRALIARAMSELGERNVSLMATGSGTALHQGLGFEAAGAIHHHQGSAFCPKLIALAPGERIRPLGLRDHAELADLYTRAAGMPRAAVMAALMEAAECVVIDRDDELLGCAVLRRYGHGYAIGPVLAPDADRAKALISHWAGTYTGAFVRIDVPAASGLSSWLDDLGLLQVDTVVTMVRGAPARPEGALKVFAIVNQSLG
ncbi:MAG: GNAT family N-acetyltransferase [Massilia sp.]